METMKLDRSYNSRILPETHAEYLENPLFFKKLKGNITRHKIKGLIVGMPVQMNKIVEK